MGDEHIISNLIKEPISNLNKYKCPPTKYDYLLTDDIFSYIDKILNINKIYDFYLNIDDIENIYLLKNRYLIEVFFNKDNLEIGDYDDITLETLTSALNTLNTKNIKFFILIDKINYKNIKIFIKYYNNFNINYIIITNNVYIVNQKDKIEIYYIKTNTCIYYYSNNKKDIHKKMNDYFQYVKCFFKNKLIYKIGYILDKYKNNIFNFKTNLYYKNYNVYYYKIKQGRTIKRSKTKSYSSYILDEYYYNSKLSNLFMF